ncbi:MAG: hypothetical protein GY722_29255 [bacterium]|nr:hypothetical protein [bacterium]
MRRSILTMMLVNLVVGVLAAPAFAGDWKKLGTRGVTDRIDHDQIVVGADEGRFTKLQLRASRSPVRLRRVVIVFGDEHKQTIERNFVIRKGGKSPVLDLDGGKRIIRRVVFTYDEASFKKKRAKVTLWGRR